MYACVTSLKSVKHGLPNHYSRCLVVFQQIERVQMFINNLLVACLNDNHITQTKFSVHLVTEIKCLGHQDHFFLRKIKILRMMTTHSFHCSSQPGLNRCNCIWLLMMFIMTSPSVDFSLRKLNLKKMIGFLNTLLTFMA